MEIDGRECEGMGNVVFVFMRPFGLQEVRGVMFVRLDEGNECLSTCAMKTLKLSSVCTWMSKHTTLTLV